MKQKYLINPKRSNKDDNRKNKGTTGRKTEKGGGSDPTTWKKYPRRPTHQREDKSRQDKQSYYSLLSHFKYNDAGFQKTFHATT